MSGAKLGSKWWLGSSQWLFTLSTPPEGLDVLWKLLCVKVMVKVSALFWFISWSSYKMKRSWTGYTLLLFTLSYCTCTFAHAQTCNYEDTWALCISLGKFFIKLLASFLSISTSFGRIIQNLAIFYIIFFSLSSFPSVGSWPLRRAPVGLPFKQTPSLPNEHSTFLTFWKDGVNAVKT